MKILKLIAFAVLLSCSISAFAQTPQNVTAKSIKITVRPPFAPYAGDSNLLYLSNGKVHRTHIAGGGGGGAVNTVFGRSGNVVALSTDYSAFYPLLSGAYVNPSWITSLPWNKITSQPTTDGINEGGTNLYFTNARARAALSWTFTTTGTSGAATGTYTPATGAFNINIPQYAPASASASYIQNQFASEQSSSNFWISGTGKSDSLVSRLLTVGFPDNIPITSSQVKIYSSTAIDFFLKMRDTLANVDRFGFKKNGDLLINEALVYEAAPQSLNAQYAKATVRMVTPIIGTESESGANMQIQPGTTSDGDVIIGNEAVDAGDYKLQSKGGVYFDATGKNILFKTGNEANGKIWQSNASGVGDWKAKDSSVIVKHGDSTFIKTYYNTGQIDSLLIVVSTGGGSGMAVGDPVTGATDGRIFFSRSGNLKDTADFKIAGSQLLLPIPSPRNPSIAPSADNQTGWVFTSYGSAGWMSQATLKHWYFYAGVKYNSDQGLFFTPSTSDLEGENADVGVTREAVGILRVNGGDAESLGTTHTGGFQTAVRNVTTTYTVVLNDYSMVCTGTSTYTITLPTATSCTGQIFVFKKTGASGTVTIDGNASETIDGAANYSLSAQWKYVQIQSDGTNWLITGNN